jgi:hypothetical protein
MALQDLSVRAKVTTPVELPTPPAGEANLLQVPPEWVTPPLQVTRAAERPRANSSWWSPSQLGALLGRRTVTAAAAAVLIGASFFTTGCAGLRTGASLDYLPQTTSAAVFSTAPVTQTDPTRLSAPVVRNSEVNWLQAHYASMARRGYAAQAQFLPGNGLEFESWSHAYETGVPRHMNVTDPPRDGVIRGTLVVNVSGHSGEADAFAKSNTYSVRIELPDGTVLERSGIPRNVVGQPGLPSDTPEYATTIDVEYPYMRGITKVSAWPDGSGGTGGYIEGRLYLVHSHDQPWDPKVQLKLAKAHRAAHPEVRWGTRFETADRKEHHVSPDPVPIRHYSN